MKQISAYPFESLSFFILIYYFSVVFLFDSTDFRNKVTFSLIGFLVFILILVFGFAFRQEMDRMKEMFFKVFLSGKFQKSSVILKGFYIFILGSIPFLVTSLFEFLFTELFTDAGIVTIGFPLPVFSFTAGRVLFMNILINTALYCLIVYFVGHVVSESGAVKSRNLPS